MSALISKFSPDIGAEEDSNDSRESKGQLCRICQSDSIAGNLISPCCCKGTLGVVHKECIETWLTQSNATKCEICCTEFRIVRTHRSLFEWLRHPTSPGDTKNIITDLVCFFVLLPLSCVSIWLCALGAKHFLSANVKGDYEALGLILVTAFLVIVFIGWIIATVRYHYYVWLLWHDTNYRIRVIGTNRLQNDSAPRRMKLQRQEIIGDDPRCVVSTIRFQQRTSPLFTHADTSAAICGPLVPRAQSYSIIQQHPTRQNDINPRRYSCVVTTV